MFERLIDQDGGNLARAMEEYALTLHPHGTRLFLYTPAIRVRHSREEYTAACKPH